MQCKYVQLGENRLERSRKTNKTKDVILMKCAYPSVVVVTTVYHIDCGISTKLVSALPRSA